MAKHESSSSTSNSYTLLLLGDLMLGRLIDQLLPTHVEEPSEARLVSSMKQSYSNLSSYTYLSPWGNSLSLLKSSDLILGNLETSITTHPTKWPDKVFNYRMHPDNIKCLTEAGVHYVSLANNHTLDFGEQGLLDTVQALKKANIKFAGAEETSDEAKRPAILHLRQPSETGEGATHEIQVYSISDHPSTWSKITNFNLLSSYTASEFSRIKSYITSSPSPLSSSEEYGTQPFKIVSIHWGPNYAWHPDPRTIVKFAHFLIDECEIDLIHGHSSHHIQGMEIYKGKPIIYGCGDFIDDYAVIKEYRSDLSGAFRVMLEEVDDFNRLKVKKVEIFPNKIQRFQAHILFPDEEDHDWVKEKFTSLSEHLGTKIKDELGEEGQIIIDLNNQ